MKYVPQRTCMGCNQKRDKNDLIRIVKNKNNEILIDKSGKKDGRGAYICEDINCLNKAIKTKRFNRVFKTKITDDFYNDLRNLILENK